MITTIALNNPQINTKYITRHWFLTRLREGQEQQKLQILKQRNINLKC